MSPADIQKESGQLSPNRSSPAPIGPPVLSPLHPPHAFGWPREVQPTTDGAGSKFPASTAFQTRTPLVTVRATP